MSNQYTIDNSDEVMDELKELILSGEKYAHLEAFENFKTEVFQRLENLENKSEDKIDFEGKLVGSKECMVDVVSPQMGKIIRKSISIQIEHINNNFKSAGIKFKNPVWWKNIINKMTGKPIESLDPKILQIFIIARESGLLLGQLEDEKAIDSDIVVGMLTAIKQFAEQTLKTGEEDLGLIKYIDHSIKLITYGSFYVAVVYQGIYSPEFELKLNAKIDAFVDNNAQLLSQLDSSNLELSKELANIFCREVEEV